MASGEDGVNVRALLCHLQNRVHRTGEVVDIAAFAAVARSEADCDDPAVRIVNRRRDLVEDESLLECLDAMDDF